jgi:hypothetical protein
MMLTRRIARFVGAAAGVLLLVLAITPAVAEAPIQVVVNGQTLVMDVEPVRVNGRVMVPARFVAEALGATVSWDDAGQRVVVTKDDQVPMLPPMPKALAPSTVRARSMSPGEC